jgi:exopolysaccharide production protein ExoQ
MANDGFAVNSSSAWLRLDFWAEAAFVALLLLVFVGLQPFEVRDAAVSAIGVPTTGAGDALRQICYVAVFALILAAAIRHRGLGAMMIVPVALALLLLWCLASALWADVPGIAFRRAGLEIVIVMAVFLSIDNIGVERALRLWRYVLIGVLIVNWISIPLIPQAVHQAGEADPGLVGNWRGLYFHKNIAGSVCAVSAILFLFSFVDTRRWIDLLLCLAAVGFLVMTKSKSSLAFLPLGLLFGGIYRMAWKNEMDRLMVMIGVGLLLVLGITVALLQADYLARFLQDSSELTGRAAIWQAEAAYIADHPLLGSGFGTFADTGAQSPLFGYFGSNTSAWVQNVAHGHNGYLQLLVTIGGIGFALAMIALIVQPALAFWPADPANLKLKSLLFAIFGFDIFHNLLESDFLEGDGVQWVTFLIVIAMLLNLNTRKPA